MTFRSSSVLALGLVLGLTIAPVARSQLSEVVHQEINHLLRYIGESGCEFRRNGNWNNSRAAEAHVRGKYDFLESLDMIDTTEDFIARAATRSSLSGELYVIRCGDNLPVPSGLWLSNELIRYRASRRS